MTGKDNNKPKKNRRQRRTKSELVDTAERRQFVLRLRRSGANYTQIAKAAIAQFGVDRLPKGYNSLYASKDVSRELKRLLAENAEDAEAVRQIMDGQLDELMLAVWPIATAPHNPEDKSKLVKPDVRMAAIDRVLRIIDRKDKIWGVSASAEKAPQEYHHLLLGLHARLPSQVTGESPLLQLSDDQMAMVLKLERALIGRNGHEALPEPVVIDGEFEGVE